MAVVAELISYPIKGCRGVSLTEATLTPAGLAHDRSFMVVDEGGVFRSQRRDPKLATIHPRISADGAQLTLRAEGMDDVQIAVDIDSARRDVELFRVPYKGIDQGGPAAEWLTEVLGAPSRLVHVPPEHDRVTDGWAPGTSHYADSSPLHLVSRASLDGLNRRLAEKGEPPMPMTRFRPNIVVDGWDEPHSEDRMRRLSIGDTELAYAKLAIRCAVTRVDQSSGIKTGLEPLRTLATYRRSSQGGAAFGVKLSVVRTGGLAVDDEVRVASWDCSEPSPDGAAAGRVGSAPG